MNAELLFHKHVPKSKNHHDNFLEYTDIIRKQDLLSIEEFHKWFILGFDYFNSDLKIAQNHIIWLISQNLFKLCLPTLDYYKRTINNPSWFERKEIQLSYKLNDFSKTIEKAEFYVKKYPNLAFGYFFLVKANYSDSSFDKGEKLYEKYLSFFSPEQILHLLKITKKYISIAELCEDQLKIEGLKNRTFWMIEHLDVLHYFNHNPNQLLGLFREITVQIDSKLADKLIPICRKNRSIKKYLSNLYLDGSPLIHNSNKLRDFIGTAVELEDFSTHTFLNKPFSKDRKVDVVFTWADMTDPSFIKKFFKTNGYLPSESTNSQTNTTRYKNNNEIQFSLRLIQKYFQEVNSIFIVTNDQYFELDFLNVEFAKKIKFVNQEDIIPSELVSSPIFNSNVIETFLWRIPDLANTFLYFCDDYFLGNYLIPDLHIFDNSGIPFLNASPKATSNPDFLIAFREFWEDVPKPKLFKYNSYKTFKITTSNSPPNINDLHLPVILSKEACSMAFELFLPTWKSNLFFKNSIRTNNCCYSLIIYQWFAFQKGLQTLGDYHSILKNSVVINAGLSSEHLKYLIEYRPLYFVINNLSDSESLYNFNKLTINYIPS